jgi:ribosomal protein L11 methyltransferase
VKHVRAWPALDVRFTDPSEPEASALRNRALALLDDYLPSALDDTRPAIWRVFFRTADDRDDAARALGQAFGGVLSLTAAEVLDDGWVERSQADLKSVTVGAVTVAPPWDVPAATAGAETDGGPRVVVIQPSMGFGTGHHASTRLCLGLLQRIDVRGARVIDVGTGSGVLALAALALGAAEAIGIDEDADAIQNARENAALNGDPFGLTLGLGTLAGMADPADPSDVIIANLSGAILRRDAAHLHRLAGSGGFLIASGFTGDEEAAVLTAFPAASVTAREIEDEWVGVLLKL